MMIRVRLDLTRPDKIAARPAKKQQLASECPLGKLYVSGGVRSKNGIGRGRAKASFKVVLRVDAPIIVIAKSFASRPHLRSANRMMTTIVAMVRKRAEPTNEMLRIAVVNGGVASV